MSHSNKKEPVSVHALQLLERRELIRQLSPETAVNVLLAFWEYLETGENPKNLSPIESVTFAAFIQNTEEAERIGK